MTDEPQYATDTAREPTPSPDAWGQSISAARQIELEALATRQRQWVEQPEAIRGDSVFKGVTLTGADIFWLAIRALTEPDASPEALADAARHLQSTSGLERGSVALSGLHLEGANLQEGSLEGAILQEAHLERANLFQAHLEGADLQEAHLEGAFLQEGLLEGAILDRAHLERANLGRAHLERANLLDAHLEGAILHAAHLEGADLYAAHLEGANLQEGSLEGAILHAAHLEGAILFQAHLEGADLYAAHLEGANLQEGSLEGAILQEAHLERANLFQAHLEGALLQEAHLERANLRESWLDSKSVLNDAIIDHITQLGDIQWSGVGVVNLTRLPWDRVPTLGDEQGVGLRASSEKHAATVRVYRQLAAQLRAQGLSEVADRFAYRAQIRQRYAYLRTIIEDWRRPWRLPGDILRYLGSAALALLAGYGYRPGRTIILYLVFISCFAALYFAYGTGCHISDPQNIALVLAQQITHAPQGYACVAPPAQPMSWNEAFIVSLTAFHGRGFLATNIKPSDPQAALAAAEAVLGLIIEVSFIATFTQRFFGAK